MQSLQVLGGRSWASVCRPSCLLISGFLPPSPALPSSMEIKAAPSTIQSHCWKSHSNAAALWWLGLGVAPGQRFQKGNLPKAGLSLWSRCCLWIASIQRAEREVGVDGDLAGSQNCWAKPWRHCSDGQAEGGSAVRVPRRAPLSASRDWNCSDSFQTERKGTEQAFLWAPPRYHAHTVLRGYSSFLQLYIQPPRLENGNNLMPEFCFQQRSQASRNSRNNVGTISINHVFCTRSPEPQTKLILPFGISEWGTREVCQPEDISLHGHVTTSEILPLPVGRSGWLSQVNDDPKGEARRPKKMWWKIHFADCANLLKGSFGTKTYYSTVCIGLGVR